MKKTILLLVIFSLIVLSFSVSAKNINFVGGYTSNSLTPEYTAQFTNTQLKLSSEAVSGNGFYFGGRYFINQKLGFGLGYDHVIAPLGISLDLSDNCNQLLLNINNDSKISGPYGEIVYRINKYINLNGAVAYYNYINDLSYDVTISGNNHNDNGDLAKGEGYGYIIGSELNYPFHKNWSLVSSLGYRTTTIDINKINMTPFGPQDNYVDTDNYLDDFDVKFKGLRFGIGLSYNF